MKVGKLFLSVLIFGLVFSLGFMGCSGKKKGFLPLLAIAGMADDGSSGGTTDDEDLLSATTSEEDDKSDSGSYSQAIGSYNANIPAGIVVTGDSAGDFTGISFYTDGGLEASGFISTVPDNGNTNSADLGSEIVSTMVGSSSISDASIVSANTVNNSDGDSTLYQVSVTTASDMTVSELTNALALQLGLSTEDVVVIQPGEGSTTDFRLVMQVTYSNTTEEVLGIGVSTEANFPENEAILTAFLDGTNIVGSSDETLSKTDAFIAKENPKVDIVWVVDNSGSMRQEQDAVIANAGYFFNQLNNKSLDFRLGVITTDKKTKNSGRPNWSTASDGEEVFKTNVNVGLKGSGKESGIYWAEYAVNNGIVVPRENARLIFVMLSDEGDYYRCYTKGGKPASGHYHAVPPCRTDRGTAFDTSNNIFVNNGYKVFSVIGLDATTAKPGICNGNGTNAKAGNNAWPDYYDLAQATGGSAGTICSNDYSELLGSITTQAAAASSDYVLSYIPMSSTIVVKNGGNVVTKSAENGWMYNSSNNSIVFSGTAFPKVGDIITVAYDYSSGAQAKANFGGSLYAYLAKNKEASLATALFILFAGLFAGYYIKKRYISVS